MGKEGAAATLPGLATSQVLLYITNQSAKIKKIKIKLLLFLDLPYRKNFIHKRQTGRTGQGKAKLMNMICVCYHRGVLLLALVFVAYSVQVQLALSASTVGFLPGFSGPLPFQLETGYVGLGESEEVQLFYYFVKSERNPQKDPLLLWLTGGPGCSGWQTLVFEIGPLNYRIEPYNGTLPTLVVNPYSWTKISSIIFVDSPVGAGFSYAKNSSAYQTGDFKQLQYLFQFFKKWLIGHPEFISNPVYISGDSYSGKILPALVQQISNGIGEGIFPPINLEGYTLGNPVTDPSDDNYKIPFAHGMGLISNELYESLEKSCGGEYYGNIDPKNTECSKDLEAYEECISGIWPGNILDPNCPSALMKPQEDKIRQRRSLNQISEELPWFGCREYPHLLGVYWANDPNVRKALHVQKGSTGEWKRCNFSMPYQYNIDSSVEYHANLSAKGYRSLIYSGDHDIMVTFLATQAWIKSLNYSIVNDWRSWVVQGQVAGFTRTYSNRMTFATVKGAGHTAPEYKPKECFVMFKRWIHSESL